MAGENYKKTKKTFQDLLMSVVFSNFAHNFKYYSL